MVQLANNEALAGDSDAKTALARPDRSSDPESSGALYSPLFNVFLLHLNHDPLELDLFPNTWAMCTSQAAPTS